MSRDMTSREWEEAIVQPREQDVERLKSYVSYVRKQAYIEGLTAHLRAGNGGGAFHECPFCSAEECDLPAHLITCEEVPDHLKGERLP